MTSASTSLCDVTHRFEHKIRFSIFLAKYLDILLSFHFHIRKSRCIRFRSYPSLCCSRCCSTREKRPMAADVRPNRITSTLIPHPHPRLRLLTDTIPTLNLHLPLLQSTENTSRICTLRHRHRSLRPMTNRHRYLPIIHLPIIRLHKNHRPVPQNHPVPVTVKPVRTGFHQVFAFDHGIYWAEDTMAIVPVDISGFQK